MMIMGAKPSYLALNAKLLKIIHVNLDLKFRLVLNRCKKNEPNVEK